jgi:endogenous inhibitor of DNA gyrase (YacG/DUF329 family)
MMVGSILWVLGLAMMFSIPFVFGFENPWELMQHYPQFPIALFIVMVVWTLGLMLAVGAFMAWLPIHFRLGCPHCERQVTLMEDKEVRRTGCCPRCHMPLFVRLSESRRLEVMNTARKEEEEKRKQLAEQRASEIGLAAISDAVPTVSEDTSLGDVDVAPDQPQATPPAKAEQDVTPKQHDYLAKKEPAKSDPAKNDQQNVTPRKHDYLSKNELPKRTHPPKGS